MIFSRTIILIYLTCICSLVVKPQSSVWEIATSQEIATAYQKACNWFIKTSSYSFKINYSSYKDPITKLKVESSTGYYKRLNSHYVTEAMGIKTIQNDRLQVTIDSADKIITLTDPGNLSPAIASIEDLEELLSSAKALRKTKQHGGTKYHIDLNKNERYEAYEFILSDQGYLQGLTYFYSEQSEKEQEDKVSDKNREIKIKPRLEINFFDFQIPANCSTSEFSEVEVLSRGKGALKLTAAYKDFRLLDYRLKAKK